MTVNTRRVRTLAGYLLADVAGALLDIGFAARRVWRLKIRPAFHKRRHGA